MAIDSGQKRGSIPGCGRPWLRTTAATGLFDEQWRLGVGNIYAGNALSPTVGGRIMSSLVNAGGLSYSGGIAGKGGGLAG